MATAQARTSLVGYAQYIDWWELYRKENGWWYKAAAIVLLSLLTLLLIGSVANVFGLKEINWVTGFVIQMAVMVFIGNPVHFIAVGGAGFIRGQAGGEAGLSANDGFKTARDWAAGFGRFVLFLGGVYAPVAFYTIAIWSIRPAPFMAFVLLAASVGLAITSAVIFKNATFFVRLLWTIYLVMVLGILLYFTAPNQVQRKLDWIEAHWSVNDADRATDAKEESIRKAHVKAAKDCTEKITVNSTRDELDRCEALRKNAGVLVYEDEAARAKSNAAQRQYKIRIQEAADCYNRLDGNATRADVDRCDAIREAAKEVVRPPAPAPKRVLDTGSSDRTAEPAKTTKVAAAWDCQPWKEVDYAPSQQFGPVELGVLPGGYRYDFAVSGRIWQVFTKAGPDGKPVFEQMCEMDAEGRTYSCVDQGGKEMLNANGAVLKTGPNRPGIAPVVAPGEGYGTFLVQSGSAVLPIGTRGSLQFSDGLATKLNVNNYLSPENYKGKGSLRVEIKQCQQT